MENIPSFFNIQNFLRSDWVILLGYVPLGIIGVWRWSVWTFKKIISFFYRNPKGKFKGSLSIVTPVYNEDPIMFQMALLSWQKNDPQEIIAVIDYSDKRCLKVFENFCKKFPGAKLIVTRVPGKRQALARGIKATTSEIVALVDSDTIWTEKLKEKALGPFEDERVGGVAPRQDVMEVDTVAKKLFRLHIFNRYGNDLIFQAAFGKALSCISGRTAFYRKRAIEKLTKELVNETFLGKKCISGDDKRLTSLIQRDGWKVKYVEKALVLTPGFSDIRTYTKQQIRWTRNSWRSDLKAVFSRWLWKNPFLLFQTLDRFFSPFALLLGPIFLVIALYRGDWIIALTLIIWWLISRPMKIAPYFLKNPKDLGVMPIQILYSYVLAVIKIYTLLTVDEQSWITRWHKDRLAVTGFMRKSFSYAATLALIAGMFFLSFEYNVRLAGKTSFREKIRLKKIEEQKKLYRTEAESQLISLEEDKFREHYESFYQKAFFNQYAYYQAGFGETLNDVRRKFLLDPEVKIYNDRGDEIPRNYYLRYQESIAISPGDLQKPNLDYYRKSRWVPIQVSRDFSEDAIRLRGPGAFVTLPEVARAINDSNILENLGQEEWILRKNLFLDEGVTLIIEGQEVKWLKLKSEKNGFAWIKAQGGNIFINNSKITSWDEQNSDYDFDWQDGRSYLLQKTSGRMDIFQSELAYLGYPGLPNRGNPFGGPYGLSWKIEDNTLKNQLATGRVEKNLIHNNYIGIYTFGATGMIFENNLVYGNVEYGIDPHDDSNNLLIQGNFVYQNGKHGIILSKRCFSNILQDNYSSDNQLHGIMLDKNSDYNLVTNNYSTNNVNGIAVNESSGNLITHNRFEENHYGLRVNNFSQNNYFSYNLISGNQKGLYLYSGSKENYISQNDFQFNTINLHLKDNSSNFISEKWAKNNIEIK